MNSLPFIDVSAYWSRNSVIDLLNDLSCGMLLRISWLLSIFRVALANRINGFSCRELSIWPLGWKSGSILHELLKRGAEDCLIWLNISNLIILLLAQLIHLSVDVSALITLLVLGGIHHDHVLGFEWLGACVDLLRVLVMI
jgi:hypothetical protein